MQPIVNGLEEEYNKNVEFQQINASTAEGLEIFNAYALFGHPSYMILKDNGEIIWQSVGEQPLEVIEDALVSVLSGF